MCCWLSSTLPISAGEPVDAWTLQIITDFLLLEAHLRPTRGRTVDGIISFLPPGVICKRRHRPPAGPKLNEENHTISSTLAVREACGLPAVMRAIDSSPQHPASRFPSSRSREWPERSCRRTLEPCKTRRRQPCRLSHSLSFRLHTDLSLGGTHRNRCQR